MPEGGVVLNNPERVGGQHGRFFCSARHPSLEEVWCRRLKGGHGDGEHAAFVHKISEPEVW